MAKTEARVGIVYLGIKSGKQILSLRICWGKSFLEIKQATLLFGQPLIIQSKENSIDFFKQEAQQVINSTYSL